MGLTSIWQWIIILAVVLLLFARPGKISGLMGDFGKGLRNFKDGVKSGDDDEADAEELAAPAPKKKAAKKAAPKKKAAKKAAKKAPAKKATAKKASAKKKAAKKS